MPRAPMSHDRRDYLRRLLNESEPDFTNGVWYVPERTKVSAGYVGDGDLTLRPSLAVAFYKRRGFVARENHYGVRLETPSFAEWIVAEGHVIDAWDEQGRTRYDLVGEPAPRISNHCRS